MPKRKREDDLEFTLAESQPGIGPAFVSLPSVTAPSDTPFQCYKTKTGDYTLVGETDAVEFVSSQRINDSGCRYLLALHDPSTSKVTLIEPATHILSRTVKKLKSIPPAPAPSALEWKQAKTVLGDTFGTKKAKAALRAAERQHVDVSAMQGVMDFVMDTIDKGAQGLPTKEEAKDELDAHRLIPPFNPTTDDPAEVYPLHDVIPENEWKDISVTPFDESTSEKDRIDLLPFKRSKWILKHLRSVAKIQSGKKKKLKLLYYIATLFAFNRYTSFKGPKSFEKDEAHTSKQLAGVPSSIIDGLLARFAESSRDSTAYNSTSTTQTKLYTYLFALCLRADNYASNVELLSIDLAIPKTRVNQLFASLGCITKKITSERERAKYGISDDLANTPMAVLKAPVQFPKAKMRRGRGGGR